MTTLVQLVVVVMEVVVAAAAAASVSVFIGLSAVFSFPCCYLPSDSPSLFYRKNVSVWVKQGSCGVPLQLDTIM